jgi:signal transduction histidine kinase
MVLNRFTALLRIAEIEAGGRCASVGAFSLDTVLRDVIELDEPLAEARELPLTVHAPVPVEVFGNIDLLSGAIENLFDTALKFTPAGGAVALDLGREAGAAVLQVIDTGPGIDPGEREAVLRPFYRSAGEQVRMTAGQGLGLSLVGAIARMHGADLEIHDNRPGLQDAAAIREPVMTQPRDSGGRRPTLRHNSFVISPLPVQA